MTADFQNSADGLVNMRQAELMQRYDPAPAADERTTLDQFLDYQRDTLLWKTDGLETGGLAQRLPDSSLTLAGLLKHLALVEDLWFRVRWVSVAGYGTRTGSFTACEPSWTVASSGHYGPQRGAVLGEYGRHHRGDIGNGTTDREAVPSGHIGHRDRCRIAVGPRPDTGAHSLRRPMEQRVVGGCSERVGIVYWSHPVFLTRLRVGIAMAPLHSDGRSQLVRCLLWFPLAGTVVGVMQPPLGDHQVTYPADPHAQPCCFLLQRTGPVRGERE